jgi:hypothetical protein
MGGELWGDDLVEKEENKLEDYLGTIWCIIKIIFGLFAAATVFLCICVGSTLLMGWLFRLSFVTNCGG